MTFEFVAELELLLPTPRLVTTKLGDIEVMPLSTMQIPPFLRAARPALDEIDASLSGDSATAALATGDWLGLLERHGESLIEAVAVAVMRPAAQIGSLPPDQTIALIQAVLEENMDFFVRRLVPAATKLVAALVGQANTMAGLMSSSDSSPTATGAPTS